MSARGASPWSLPATTAEPIAPNCMVGAVRRVDRDIASPASFAITS